MSVSRMHQTNTGSLVNRTFFVRVVVYGFLFSILGFAEMKLDAQEIKIRLIDGRNVQPLANTCVNVWVGNDRKQSTAVSTDAQGVVTLHLATESSKIDTNHQWNGCGLFGVIDPVFMYHDNIRINVGYVLCQTNAGDHSWLRSNKYSVKELVQTGIVSTTTCGKGTEGRQPGELIIFVRPLSWWERLKQ